MGGLLLTRIPVPARRAVSRIPALTLLAIGADPTQALVFSQVALSFGIPFALIPLFLLTGNAKVMGSYRDGPALRFAAVVAIALAIALNGVLLFLTVPGQG